MQKAETPRNSGFRISGRWILLAIATVCLLPLAAAMYFRFVSPPPLVSPAGKPLEPFAFPYKSVQQMDGQPLSHPAVNDHWLVVHFESGSCASACRYALYLTRQARLAQGRYMDRLQRLWIVSDAKPPNGELLAANPDIALIHATDDSVAQQFGTSLASESPAIYLVDRRGFVVFQYQTTVDPMVFIREIGKLVRF